MNRPNYKDRRTGEDRRKCHLNLEGTYFIERRRRGVCRRESDRRDMDQVIDPISPPEKQPECMLGLK